MSINLLLILSFLLIIGCNSTPLKNSPTVDESKDNWEWRRHPSVQEEFSTSKTVFVGKVADEKNILDRNDFIIGTFYSLRVEEVLKGSPPQIVKLYIENTSGRFPMEVGMSYLIFAEEERFEGVKGLQLSVNGSGNSMTIKEAAKILETVRKLRKK